jgi:hypothetical protein
LRIAAASALNAVDIFDSALGDKAVAITGRTALCSGGSSVKRISGRMEFGSCHGRDIETMRALRTASRLNKSSAQIGVTAAI